MAEYVIIGNGTAAVGCIEGIRSVDTDSTITVISGEKHHVYSRPLISYLLEGKTDTEKMKYRPADFYKKNKVEVIWGKAVKCDSKKQFITLDSKEKLHYDKLCLCTGSSPFVPKFEGLEKVKNKFSFMTLDDALALDKVLSKDAKVMIVGAGLIGLKCAEGIADRVGSITVCDLADRVLSSILDSECAAVMQHKLEEHGISFLLGDTAVRFDKNKAYMKNGAEVAFDILVLAVGVRAETELAVQAKCEVNRGIIADTRMQTSNANIYAAGDCAEGYDSSIGANRVLAILPNAYMQGRCAGINMAGGSDEFSNAVPMNSIGFFGLHCATAGAYPEDGEVYEEKYSEGIKRLYIKDGRLHGYMLIGNVNRAGIYTSIVREQTVFDEEDLNKLKTNPSLAIFSHETRRKKLGGVV